MQLAHGSRTVGIPECGGLRIATRLRGCMTSGTALLGVGAIAAAMPVAPDLSKNQAHAAHLVAASDNVIDTSAGLEQKVGEGIGDVVSATGSLGVVGRHDLPAGSLVGLGDRFVYPSLATSTFFNQKNRGQGVLAGPLPIDGQIVATQVRSVRVISTAFRSSLSGFAAGMAIIPSALQPALGDFSSGRTACAFRELQAALLHVLVKLAVNLVLLQSALRGVLVTLNRNVGLESLLTAQPRFQSSVMDFSTPLADVGRTRSDATADLPPDSALIHRAELACWVLTCLV